MKLKTLILCIFLFGFAQGVQAFTIALGSNIARHELMVTNSEDGSGVARFDSPVYASPTVHIVTNPNYFSNTRIGWLFEFNFGVLDIKQNNAELGSESVDSNVTGAFGHLNPILFYRLGDKTIQGPRKWSVMAGVGYGVSYIMLNGDFVTTSLPLEQREQRSIKDEGFFLLPATIFDASYNNWFLKMVACFGGTGFDSDGYSYKVLFRSVGVGYSFHF